MLNKILSIFLLGMLSFVVLKNFSVGDDNLDVARRIVCEYALLYGDTNLFQQQNKLIKNKSLVYEDFKYIKLKKSIMENSYDASTIDSEIETCKQQHQSVLYTIIAINEYKQSNIERYNNYIFKAYVRASSLNNIKMQVELIEIIDMLQEINGKITNEHAMEFIRLLPSSSAKLLRLYAMGARKDCMQKFFGTPNRKAVYGDDYWSLSRANSLRKAGGKYSENLSKNFYVDDFVKNKSKTKNFSAFKYPLRAYISYLVGDTSSYEKFRDISLSENQMDCVAFDFYNYIEYASSIFILTNDTNAVFALLRATQDGHQKNAILKRIVRGIAKNRKSINRFAEEFLSK